MKKIETTYAEFYEMQKNSTTQYYVKNHLGEYTPILDAVQKRSNTYILEFDNDYVLEVGDKHAFMDIAGNEVIAENIQPEQLIKTIHGAIRCVARHTFKSDQLVYDISVPAPHWYVNDDLEIIHHNSGFGLLMGATYLKKYDDAVLLFYDSEFGAPQSYFKGFGIDTSRVLHTPVTNIEELKFDLMGQLDTLSRKDKVIIIIDSLGNIASKKEVEDALNEKSVADMTRAKAMKSLFRMVTPNLRLKDIPIFAVAHTYKDTSAFFPTDVVSGGTGIMLGADNLWIIGRQQDKDGKDIQGYHFVIKIEKSRYVREKSKIPISVSFEGGISKWSGLLECGLESGWVKKPKNGWYVPYEDPDDEHTAGKSVRMKDTQTSEFWTPLLENEGFVSWIEKKYSLHIDEEIV